MKTTTKAHIAVLLANLFFGINFAVMQYVSTHLMAPIALNALRVVGAAILFWVMVPFQKNKTPLQKKDIGRLILCMLTGVLLNQVLFVKGVSLSVPIHASLLMLSTPIAVVFISAWLLKTIITRVQILGLLFGIMGAGLLISMREAGAKGQNILLGDILIIINATSYAFYLVLVKPLMQRYAALSLMRWMFTIALFAILPFAIQPIASIQWSLFAINDWLALSFIILAVTFLAYLFNIYSIQVLGPTTTGAYIYTQPFFVAVIAIFIAKDYSNLWYKTMAAVLIFISVYLVSFAKHSSKKNSD
jgi:drug/metabolite transporter (DMT)-like permease